MITKNSSGGTLSAAYASAVRAATRQFTAALYVDGVALDCEIIKAEVSKGSCSGTEFSIGNIVTNALYAEFKGVSTDLKGKAIQLRIGLLINDAYEWVTLGNFTVTSAKRHLGTASITAMGPTSQMGEMCDDITTLTLARIATEIYAKSGVRVTFESGIDTSLVVAEPIKGLTAYQALQILASVVGGFAKEQYDGTVKICRYSTARSLTANPGMMLRAPNLDETFTVTGVNCVTSEGSDTVPAEGYTAGTPNLEIHNRWVTQDLFTPMAAQLMQYSYTPGTVFMSLGDPRIEADDVLAVTDVDGAIYGVPCHIITHTFDGGFSTQIQAVNASNPVAVKSKIQQLLDSIQSKVVDANAASSAAAAIARNTNQHFWHVVSGSDTGAHITEIPQEDFLDDPANGGANLLARSNGIAVRDGLTELATFGAGQVQIGQSGDYNAVITPYKFELSSAANIFFKVKDLRGETEIITTLVADGTQNQWSLGAAIKSVSSVTLNGTSVSYTVSNNRVTLSASVRDGDIIVVTWIAADVVPVLIFGTTNDENKMGAGASVFGQGCTAGGINSHAEGEDSDAVGYASHAEGANTIAGRNYAHAEGCYSRADGSGSHAEGWASVATAEAAHAEGNGAEANGKHSHAEGSLTVTEAEAAHAEGKKTTASAIAAHAEGFNCTADGAYSHAGGLWAVANGEKSFAHGNRVQADYDNQTVIGEYNESTAGLFIIGNGSSFTRKNAMVVDGNGNVTISGTLTQSSDARLKEHIDYLGDEAVEFIDRLKPAHYIKDGNDHVGFYAQDVEEADEWNCMTGEMNGYLTLSYAELIAPIVTYCQRLEKRIKELEVIIDDNKNN